MKKKQAYKTFALRKIFKLKMFERGMADISYIRSRIKEMMKKFGEDISSVREYNKNLYVKIRGKKEFLEIKDAFDECNRLDIKNIAYPLAYQLADEIIKKTIPYESPFRGLEMYKLHNKFIEALSGKKPSKLEEKVEEEEKQITVPAAAIATFLLLAAFTCFVFTKKIITTYAILDTEIKTLNPFLILGIFLLAAAILFFVKSKKSKK